MIKNAPNHNIHIPKAERLYEQLLDYSSPQKFNAEKIKQLIELGADITNRAIEKQRYTNLIWNIIKFSPDEDTAIDLLKFIHSRDNQAIYRVVTPAPLIYYPVNNMHFKLAKSLIDDLGYPVDTINKLGETSLYRLVEHNIAPKFLMDKIKFLLAHGADPVKPNKHDKTPIQAAEQDSIRMLLIAVAKGRIRRETITYQIPVFKKPLENTKLTIKQPVNAHYFISSVLQTLFSKLSRSKTHSEYQQIFQEDENKPKMKQA